jgi:HAD superfamily hydrolase (TIGR01459 family)
MPPAPLSDPTPIPLVASIGPLAEDTSAWLVDIWGVMHNGVTPYADAVAACRRYRDAGGIVVLVSNSPRPDASVAAQLDGIGVARAAYDAIVTSGDVARSLVGRYAGRSVLHIGPERDVGVFAGLDIVRVDPEAADVVVCTGLFNDEHETPADYTDILMDCRTRQLPMICANPDIMVERGGRMIFCAGAIAAAYAAAGGEVAYAGKPFAPIYARTFATLERLKPGSSERARLLAIGDGINTDIAGAAGVGVRSVFVASGVHVQGGLDSAALEELFPPGAPRPVAAMPKLAW